MALDTIQQAFGRHDVLGVSTYVGGPAERACHDMGANAYGRPRSRARRPATRGRAPPRPMVPSPIEDAIFEASLRTPWGILGLLASDNQSWLYPTARHEPFLRAALAAWDELDAVGARYCYSFHGERLWSVTNNLHYTLANMGVPNEILRAPLPAGDRAPCSSTLNRPTDLAVRAI